MVIDENEINELVRLKGETLFHREGQELEFKEQFNLAALADYFKDFAAFSNNRGGFLIFGIKDSPRQRTGLSEKSLVQFEKTDPEKITGYLLDTFSSEIRWEAAHINIDGADLGIFRIYEAGTKPVIAKKDEGKDQAIKNGEIYYRYGGRTQKIQSAELENIINKRIETNNKYWLDLMSKIGSAGPQNAAILDTKKSLISKGDSQILVIDEELSQKIKFVKEGHFVDKGGAETLKLVGDVVPINKVEVVKKVKEDLFKDYPLSATQIWREVKKKHPTAKQNAVWKTINENGLKDNLDYSSYNFSNKENKDKYEKSGIAPKGTGSIYKESAVDLIIKILKDSP